jgi:hypothetical protein
MYQTLGYVKVASGGSPVQAAANAPGKLTNVQKIVVQAHPSNAGVGYVGRKGMSTSTGVGVCAVIPKPVSTTTGPFAEVVLDAPTQLGGMQLSDLYIDGTTNDLFLVRYI